MPVISKTLQPWLIIKNINHLCIDHLKSNGIKAIAFDKDNTLTKPFDNILHPEFVESFALLKRHFDCVIVSNSAGLYSHDPSGEMARQVERALGIPVLMHRKRKPLGSTELLNHLHYASDQIAIVGDRYLTDVLYAHFGNMRSILVQDIITEEGDDYWAIKVRHSR